MSDEDHNRFESNKKWIEWKSLSDGETLLYSQKNYNKPGDEEALKKKIRYKMKQSDDWARKRQVDAGPPKRSRVKYEDGIEKVKNNKKWKEWIHLEITGSTRYKGRTFKKNVPDNGVKLMNRIIKSTEYNQRYSREHKELMKNAALLVNIRGKGGNENNIKGIMVNGAEDDDNRKPAADTMGEDGGGKEGGEETCTKPESKNVNLASPDEESVLQISWEKNDDGFKVNGIDLGQGEEETALTDGVMVNTGSDAGANVGSVDHMDEIEDFEVDGSNFLGRGEEETSLTDDEKKDHPVRNTGTNIRSDRIQCLNRMITDEDELKLNKNYSKKDKNRLEKGCLYASDIERYLEYLQRRDDEKCLKNIKEKPSLFYDTTFINFDKKNQPYYNMESKRLKALRNDIFRMKHIFIPIQYGKHYTCVVVTMEEGKKRIDYYDSLKLNKTRSKGFHKEGFQISILKVVLSYLQMKQVELNKDKSWSSDWIQNPSCEAPQQENRIDCGVFVCMYIDFIHSGCKLDFTQEDIINGGWRKNMMLLKLLIQPVERIDKEKGDKNDEDIQVEENRRMEFGKKASKIISENKEWTDNVVSTELCSENISMNVECDENCKGGEECVNKKNKNTSGKR